jgi:hypothetical protein
VSDLFQAAESTPPFPLLVPRSGEREAAKNVENPAEKVKVRERPKILADLLKNIRSDGLEGRGQ